MDFSMDMDNSIGKTVASIEATMKEEWEKVMDNFTTDKVKVYAEEYGEEEYYKVKDSINSLEVQRIE